MTTEIQAVLLALEQLSSSTSTSSSGPLNILLETHFIQAKERILSGDNPRAVITDLQKNVVKAKKDVEKGLKTWYGALGNVGKAIDTGFPPTLSNISATYDNPSLFSSHEETEALNRAILSSLGRRGLWHAVTAFEEETGLKYDPENRKLAEELYGIVQDIERGEISRALQWCDENKDFLRAPPHPSSLPFQLHRTVFSNLPPKDAILYARQYLMPFMMTHEVLPLLASALYQDRQIPSGGSTTEKGGTQSLVDLFRMEYCRRHNWPQEDPLEVIVDLGSRGGALNAVEKARKVIGERLGDVRTWDELPMEIPLPASRRYHSVFVCPVSKEQATEINPPKMLPCGHAIASESLKNLIKPGRVKAKCPYCPMEMSVNAAQRLYL